MDRGFRAVQRVDHRIAQVPVLRLIVPVLVLARVLAVPVLASDRLRIVAAEVLVLVPHLAQALVPRIVPIPAVLILVLRAQVLVPLHIAVDLDQHRVA